HRDPAVAAAVRPNLTEGTFDLAEPGGLAEVLATGRSLLYPQMPQWLVERVARAADATGIADAFQPVSGMAVALVVQGRTIGAVVLARIDGDPYGADDLELVEDLAARSAVALDNAQRYTRERDAALTLQRSLLPQRLPAHPNMRFAWRYLPGAEGALIGGDWYDVIPLDDGRVGLLIGDVMGRGLSAAAVMGQLRASARAHASSDTAPAALLAGLDQAVGRLEQSQITTCLYGVLDPTTRVLTVASAGHLPPLVASPAGGGYFLDVDPGAPLGAGVTGYPELQIVLPAGSTLLLYTDGLVEERARPVDEGLA
nr:SpoIIE family protein phosphatase [Micromonospora sp. DSM 115978]